MSNPWSKIQKPSTNLNVILIETEHPLQLYWGRDTLGRYLFLADIPLTHFFENEKLPKLSGISVAIDNSGTNSRLALILNEHANWELFYPLCFDLVKATKATHTVKVAGLTLLQRLVRWQNFLKRERLNTLSLETAKGLIGELLFLKEKAACSFNWEDAIAFWKGPENAPQDFAIHDTAVEVKCQSGGSKPTVRITSAEQLEPQLPEAYLAVYTLASADKEDPNSFTLNTLVAAIRRKLDTTSEATRERFEDLLFMVGYLYSEEYEQYRFAKIALRCYKIEEDFPRIRTRGLSQGIERITYSLKLEACAPFEKSPEWWKNKNES